jgi:hypothetical protein
MAEPTRKKIVEQISDDKAYEILSDMDFIKARSVNRIFHVVRDPRDPSIIISMTVMENAPAGAQVSNPPQAGGSRSG